jgi:hypothetical protein
MRNRSDITPMRRELSYCSPDVGRSALAEGKLALMESTLLVMSDRVMALEAVRRMILWTSAHWSDYEYLAFSAEG